MRQGKNMTTSAPEPDDYLKRVFAAGSRVELDLAYADWAARYDADMAATGYLHLPVAAGLVARHVSRKSSALLDVGVGTGALGQVLGLLGYSNLQGLDMSEAMLAQARARACFTDLRKGVLGEPLAYPDGHFDCLVSTVTFTTGHAPATAFDELVRILKPGGFLISTFGIVAWEDAGFRRKLGALAARKLIAEIEVTQVYRPMPHSPAERDFEARAHVFRRVGG
jgi:ubiquinone/menaquinone biosynthesis C-methylase UbiE